MPELPEVETIKRGIEESIIGHSVLNVQTTKLASKLRIPTPDNIDCLLQNKVFTNCERLGKYILMHLSADYACCVHLGMSGRILVSHSKPQDNPHNHVIMTLLSPSKQKLYLCFHDPRRFGLFTVLTPQNKSINSLDKLGNDPFNMSAEDLLNVCKKRSIPIKNLLLDQSAIAGLGNIYVSEALWLAHIHPLQKACSLNLKQSQKLIKDIQHVLSNAIKQGGSTLKDHRKADGSMGLFQNLWNAYQQENKICSICRHPHLIQKITISARSSFFCPNHQKNQTNL